MKTEVGGKGKVKVKVKGRGPTADLVPNPVRGEHAGDQGVREHPAPHSRGDPSEHRRHNDHARGASRQTPSARPAVFPLERSRVRIVALRLG